MALVEQVSEQVAAPLPLLTTTKVERAPAALASGDAQIGDAALSMLSSIPSGTYRGPRSPETPPRNRQPAVRPAAGGDL